MNATNSTASDARASKPALGFAASPQPKSKAATGAKPKDNGPPPIIEEESAFGSIQPDSVMFEPGANEGGDSMLETARIICSTKPLFYDCLLRN